MAELRSFLVKEDTMALFTIPEQEQEIWKDVVGFEGYYQVSNLGRVKSLKRVTCDGKHIAEKLKKVTLTEALYTVLFSYLKTTLVTTD